MQLPKQGTIVTPHGRYRFVQKRSRIWNIYHRNELIGQLFGKPNLLFKPLHTYDFEYKFKPIQQFETYTRRYIKSNSINMRQPRIKSHFTKVKVNP